MKEAKKLCYKEVITKSKN